MTRDAVRYKTKPRAFAEKPRVFAKEAPGLQRGTPASPRSAPGPQRDARDSLYMPRTKNNDFPGRIEEAPGMHRKSLKY